MKRLLPNRRPPQAARQTVEYLHSSPAQLLLQELLGSSLLLTEDWESLPPAVREELECLTRREVLLQQLVEHGLLTDYQAARVDAGKTFGLILGNYRILDRLGAGGMGVVFKAEHVRLRRHVAIKVLPPSSEQDPRLLMRFYTEVRAIAALHHPNIVGALDAGETVGDGPDGQILHYLVMEYVPGQNLETFVELAGPLSPGKACDLIHQVACGLDEAYRHHLVHRDVKPSNILVTPEGQAKLLDFGLARHFRTRMTEPGTILGSFDYMAPEQARDSSSVDIRADIYGLGGSLFWCLTGRTPFVPRDSIAEELACRLTQPPPSVRALEPSVPPELDAVVAGLMAVHPDDRYPTPQAVMRALLTFLQPVNCRLQTAYLRSEERSFSPQDGRGEERSPLALRSSPLATRHQVLIVDDERCVRELCRCALEAEGMECAEASGGLLALEMCRTTPFDLVLLDVNMPEMTGQEVCRRLREFSPCAHQKVILFSGAASNDELAAMLLAGADDYLAKPFTLVQLLSQIKAALRLKDAQDRADLLNRHLLSVNHELEQSINARDGELIHARNALVLALAKLVEHRDCETGSHLLRMQRYARVLAEDAADLPTFVGQIDPSFIDLIVCCIPLHDIGKVGLPDHILLKPGKLSSDERILMQTHTTIGADTLATVLKQHGQAVVFLQMAIDIARHHHERWDGQGYPDRLTGPDIPLPARLTSIADVYDALRSRRVYKPALAHAVAVQMMTEGSAGQFDPALIQAFARCADQFASIYREFRD